jgi:4-hydroxy-2-oxoheptanedioate aldolase
MTTDIAALRRRIAAGDRLIGTWVCNPSGDIVEMLGHAGFDFAILDLEHGPFGIDALPGLFRAAEVAGIAPFVRIPAQASDLVAKAIDAGAAGIVVPSIASADEGAAMIALTRYAPKGRRGAHNSTRALAYSALSFNDALANDDAARPIIVLQIEQALPDAGIDAIAALDGLDVLFVGAYDLSLTMGLAGQFDHPEVRDAIDMIVAAGRAQACAIGLWTPQASAVGALEQRGFTFLTIANSETIFFQAARAIANEAKASSPETA